MYVVCRNVFILEKFSSYKYACFSLFFVLATHPALLNIFELTDVTILHEHTHCSVEFTPLPSLSSLFEVDIFVVR
jgi:hypothetical protein